MNLYENFFQYIPVTVKISSTRSVLPFSCLNFVFLLPICIWYSSCMDNKVINRVFRILTQEVLAWQEPIVGRVAHEKDPFKILIATMLSLRTKDSTTDEAARRLFSLASTPFMLSDIPQPVVEEAIYPVGFYKTKARSILQTARMIMEKHLGQVPDTMEELLEFPGVGRKTANLVLILGFDKMGICVDTHVHRITNRWGYVKTKTPDETEIVLRRVLPKRHWKQINNLLVPYGQNLCLPVNPSCSRCTINTYCDRVAVRRYR